MGGTNKAMAGVTLEPARGEWAAPGHTLRIEYALPALEQIRVDAIEGFNKVPHGGIEVGGVLFGAKESNTVVIAAARPLACEYALGPSFVLSEKDQSALRELLAAAPKDPELAGLVPVGWYHAHTRSGISLSGRDIELFNRFFPEPWQIALVVRPANFSPSRAGFFFRESNGSIHAESSYAEFDLPSLARTEPPQQNPEPAPETARALPAPVVLPAAVRSRRGWRTYAVAVIDR